MKKVLIFSLCSVFILLGSMSYYFDLPFQIYHIGEEIDSMNGVSVYYNGSSPSIHGLHFSEEGYELGVKWQCVEFVRRYYYQNFNHCMPESTGNAMDYFNASISSGDINEDRLLFQFENNGNRRPKVGDILVFSGGYGHVAIVSYVGVDELEIIQQNVNKTTRQKFLFSNEKERRIIGTENLLGWLSLKP